MNSIARTFHRWNPLPALTVTTGLVTLLLTSPALAQERLLRTLTVTGRGTESIATTLTQVRLGVEAQGKTADAVQQDVARRSTAVVNLLRSRQVDKLETTGINLSPTYRYDNGKQTLTGYSASNLVSFRIATEQVGTLLDEAVQAGASRIDGVSFIATDEAIAAAQKLALKSATQDARAQADAVFNALGLTKREIVSVQINGAMPPMPRLLKQSALESRAADSRVPVPVVGGEQQVEAAVTLEIRY
jgi:uncharacterized protein YggE